MRYYMLVFWAPRQLLTAPRSAAEAGASGEKWRAWDQALRAAGHTVEGIQLEPEGRRVIGAAKTVVDGVCGGDEVMGGYFVISAANLEEATERAKGVRCSRTVGRWKCARRCRRVDRLYWQAMPTESTRDPPRPSSPTTTAATPGQRSSKISPLR
jgi:hypothetical protein